MANKSKTGRGGKRDAGKERFWRDVVQRHAASGLRVRAFCRREQLAEASFYAWRGTIAKRDATEQRPTRQTSPSLGPAFLPVAIRDLPPAGAIVIELRGGHVLRLPESIAAVRLAELVVALEVQAGR